MTRGIWIGLCGTLLLIAGCGDTTPADGGPGGDLRMGNDLSAVMGDMGPGADIGPAPDGGPASDMTAAPDGGPAPDGAPASDMTPAPDGGAMNTIHVGPGGMFVFSPASMTIKAGQSVHWVWDSGGHTVTSGTNGTADNKFCAPTDMNCAMAPTQNAGFTYDHTFPMAGSFPYFCKPHFGAGMTGTITVM